MQLVGNLEGFQPGSVFKLLLTRPATVAVFYPGEHTREPREPARLAIW
ncbi:MAG: hypothetical protein AB1556_06730 [Bacillota bacterium]